jgi:uncharacterized protein (TIGR01619 family)
MTITENWDSYLCTVNDGTASIFLNLDLATHAPLPGKSWLLWVWVYFNAPRPDGLSSSQEAPKLFEIEDRIVPTVSQQCSALMAGRLTTASRREFYMYGEETTGFKQAVTDAMSVFPDYRFDCNFQHDPEWKHYLDVLYPSQPERQRMENRKLRDVLKKRGDRHEIARKVDHMIFFRDADSRELFCRSAIVLGYTFRMLPVSDPGFYPIEIARCQPVTENTIDEAILELLSLAAKFDGEYDGWGCEVQN